MTGYLVFVPEKDAVPLDISIDDAFRLIMSGGVIVPGAKKNAAPSADEAPKPSSAQPARQDGA